MRRILAVALIALIPLPAVAGRSTRSSIDAGEATFWTGPFVKTATSNSCLKGMCWTYQLHLEETGYRLRIAIDRPEIGDVFVADIFDPGGRQVGSISPGVDLYSDEFLQAEPRPGTWKIEVRAEDVTESAFRLRAKLEANAPSIGSKDAKVLPNLQVLPPHEASFLMPVSNGFAGGNPMALDLMGTESCHPEEHAEEQALRCLRFAFGIRNTGLGPLELHNSGTIGLDNDLIQRVHRADGTYFDRPAGMARFHKTHGHYHHHDAVALQLFLVTDTKTGAFEASGDKHFKGFAHRDELLRDWEHFYPTWSKSGFGLLPGWSDIYEWDRPGNYIDFGLNGDGHYLIRMWADPVRGILESNTKDNVGYTYLEVTGSTVELIESGRGSDPWDPCKIVVGFGGHPDPRPESLRPKGCPPDTT
jgi:hypothetical protein